MLAQIQGVKESVTVAAGVTDMPEENLLPLLHCPCNTDLIQEFKRF